MSRTGRVFLSAVLAVGMLWAASAALAARIPKQSPAQVQKAYDHLSRVGLQATRLDAQARANAAEVKQLRATIAELKTSIAALGSGHGG